MALAGFCTIMAGLGAGRGNAVLAIIWMAAAGCCLLDAFGARKERQ